MNREIKFRAWVNSEMIFDIQNSSGANSPTFAHYLEWKDCKVMQYTGLKDKNGKEIYEGDIVKIEGFINHVVGFEDGAFRWMNVGPYLPIAERISERECEVIGNIYENPELLKL